ncbi:MAG: DNA polymerase III subunit delta [Candidatus Sericytochromatia bacterium]|nr:DNA polymerase III subunit delta [Candidatus Sericytochromatia bacterium]
MAARKPAVAGTPDLSLGVLHWGDDRLVLAEQQQRLIDSVIDPDWASLNLLRLSGGTAGNALSCAGTPAFGAGGRLVIVSLSTDEAQTFFDELAALWDSHLPMVGNVLLIETTTIDRRRKGTKALETRLTVRNFALPKSWDAQKTLGPWIDQRLASRGASIAPDARLALIEAVGTDTTRIAGELDKLLIWQGAAGRITLPAVKALVAATEADVFGLLSALAAGDRGGALVEAQTLLSQDPKALPKFVAGLAANLLLVKRAKDLLAAGQSPGDAATWLGVHPFRLQNLLGEWRRWRPEELQSAVMALAEVDRRSKTSAWSNSSLLETWIIRFPQAWPATRAVSFV